MASGSSLMSGCALLTAGVCSLSQLGSLCSNRGMQTECYCHCV